MAQRIRKAVIPAAGYGTRFLPMTKASPKEMLPIVDKPVIQYVVEEAAASGIEEIVIITGSNKRAIEDHFDYNFELEEILKRSGKMDQYHEIRAISDLAKFVYVRQKEQLGNGHAVLQAKEIIGDEPFLVLWGDEFSNCTPPRAKQLIDAYAYYGGAVLNAVLTTDPQAPHRYAVLTGERVSEVDTRVERMVEKPGDTAKAPYLVSIGAYALPPTIFAILENLKPGKGGEIWLPDAIAELMNHEAVYAHELQGGVDYDCGNKLDYLKANIDIALSRKDIAPELTEFLHHTLKEHREK